MSESQYKHKFEELLAQCKKNLRVVNEDLLRRAYEFSLEAHKNDMRASGEPFFSHPYEVAMIVASEIPLDDVSVASALLHDVVEDSDYEIKDIRAEFGDTIANIVDGATKISDIFKSHEVTQAVNYRKMLISMVNDIRVMLLKFADRLHNMRTVKHLPKEQQERLAKETLDIYAPFAHRFGLAKIQFELEDLAFEVLHPREFNEIARKLKSERKEREAYIKKFTAPLYERLKEEKMKFEIEGRPKHHYSIYTKMIRREKPLDQIYDLFAVRVILESDNPNDCFKAYGVIVSIYYPLPEHFNDYISVPKKNGYQSLHGTVIGPDGKLVEVQVRTRAMHEIAEKGVAAHWKYKENLSALDEELENWISWVREIFEHADGDQPVTQLMESFKLTLYQDEIYVFTPKGKLVILPKGATPIDFAFAVHSNIGFHCLSAKVNGRIVALDEQLSSGDQVEIITSKKQTPSADWEKFAVTHRAKSQVRKWLKDEERKNAALGREQWEKKLKKYKIHLKENDLVKYLHNYDVGSVKEFYLKIKKEEIDPDIIAQDIEKKLKHPPQKVTKVPTIEGIWSRFVQTARKLTGGITLSGTADTFLHSFARCCNPIPGDPIIGYVTTGEGIKVHSRKCKNIETLKKTEPQRLVEIAWPDTDGSEFAAAIRISGIDRTGILNDITHSISHFQDANIKGINVEAKDTMFDGVIILNVRNTEHLNRIIEKIKKVKNVNTAERLFE